jgi:hypothetical protein
MYADFCFPLEPAGGEEKSDNIKQKTVTLIYSYPTVTTSTIIENS